MLCIRIVFRKINKLYQIRPDKFPGRYELTRLYIIIPLLLIAFVLNEAVAGEGIRWDEIEGKTLTLEQCIRIAVEKHPDIKSKIAQLNAGKARVGQSFSSFLPSLDLSSGYSKFETKRHQESSDSGDNYTVGFALSQTIFDFGRSISRWKMSKAEAEAISYILNTTGQEIVFNVEEAYYSYLKALRLKKVNQEALALAQLHLKQAGGSYEAGTRPKIDVVRTEADLSNAKVELIKAKNGVRLSRVNLNNAMGMSRPVSYRIKDDLEFKKLDYHMDEALVIAYKNRPELLELKARLTALEQKIKFCRSEYRPQLSARFSQDWQDNRAPLDREWRAGITLDVPLFSGLDTSYKLREAREELKSAGSRIDSLKLQIRAEVERAILTLREARERVFATETAVAQARENLRLAEGRYGVGLATIIDLTDARVLLLEISANRVHALYDHRIADALIKKACGTIPFRIEG